MRSYLGDAVSELYLNYLVNAILQLIRTKSGISYSVCSSITYYARRRLSPAFAAASAVISSLALLHLLPIPRLSESRAKKLE